jgi:hypothetical protein
VWGRLKGAKRAGFVPGDGRRLDDRAIEYLVGVKFEAGLLGR